MSRIVIFANGVFNRPDLVRSRLRSTDRIFCADGGTRHALALDLIPECIIGDLDSLSPELVEQMAAVDVGLRRYPRNKDQTDLELALQLAITEKPAEILLVAVLGGRLDQALANILLLTRLEYASAQLNLVDGPQWAALLRGPQTMTVHGQPGDTLSLVPLTPTVTGVTLTGVVWPLNEATLSFGSTFTLSNSLVGSQATVHIGAGMVLLIHFDRNDEEELRK